MGDDPLAAFLFLRKEDPRRKSMNSLSNQVSQIVQNLVGLQGSSDISIVSRRYPRIGPAESGVGYEEQSSHFTAATMPADVALPPDTDEVVIHLKGSLSSADLAGDLKQRVNDFMNEMEMMDTWDIRSHFHDQPSNKAYQFTLFTNFVPRGGPVDLA